MRRNPKRAKNRFSKFALIKLSCAISMLALRALNLVVRRFKKHLYGRNFAYLRPFEKIRALKFLVFNRFGEKFSLYRFYDGLRREILHAGVGF